MNENPAHIILAGIMEAQVEMPDASPLTFLALQQSLPPQWKDEEYQ